MRGDVVNEARIGLGGVAYKPWRAAEAEEALKGRKLDEDSARAAAEIAFKSAVTHGQNDFKPELGRRNFGARAARGESVGDITMSGQSVKIGDAAPRWDARKKVTGMAVYGMDEPVPHALYAYLVTSAIARGHIVSIDDGDSRAVFGVVDVLTYRDVGERIKSGKIALDHGYMGTSIAPLSSNKIWHDGQIVAMVVAETFEFSRARRRIGCESNTSRRRRPPV